MIYQLWRIEDGEILIVSTRTDTGRKQAKRLEEQGCDFVGTVESALPPDTIRDGVAKKYIDLGTEAARWNKRLAAKIEEAQAIIAQMRAAMEVRHDKR
ncbi:MAG: hypothetical protein LUC35_00095 [Clostridiales bacterium]|nr:hypothetical protein [Clostridiales bacterium]